MFGILSNRTSPRHPAFAAALADCRWALRSVALLSGMVNILMLAGPLYMLQIYDRVLASRSVPTLVALSIFLLVALVFQFLLDLIRSRIVVRAAALIDQRLDTIIHGLVIRAAVRERDSSQMLQPVRDLDYIRSFLTGAGPIAIVDLPWAPLFLIVCFMIHFWLGVVSLAGATILFVVTLLTERASRAPAREVAQYAGDRASAIEADRRNSETAIAMGMVSTLAHRWNRINRRYLSAIERSSDVVGSYGSLTKMLRFLLQSAILGFGAYFVIRQELTAGAMIAASIMMGRALAPIEVAIANWRGFVAARDSARRLSETLARSSVERSAMELPKPSRSFEVEHVTVAAPDGRVQIVSGVHFKLSTGEVLGIIGPNGSGKTSLIRVLAGVWAPGRGAVRLDGVSLDHWNAEQRGRHIGYLAQSVELFDGTISENIARMSLEPDDAAVLEAARQAAAHDMIVRLPAGYGTRIGEAGAILSAGQRQRIALARAVYGSPFVVLLDEPGSNLDADGENALQLAIRNLKARGAIIVLIAHRPSALAQCDKVLYLINGRQQAFGPRDEVLRKLAPPPQPAAAGTGLKVVGEPGTGSN